LVVTLLSESVWNNSVVSTVAIRLVHEGWDLGVIVISLKLEVLLLIGFAIGSLLNLNEVVKNGESGTMSNDLVFGDLNLGGGNETEEGSNDKY
jgi:hypothetical protein